MDLLKSLPSTLDMKIALLDAKDYIQPKLDVKTVLVGSTAFLSATWMYRKWQYNAKYKLPAGPPRTFFAGNLGIFENDPQCYKTITNLRKNYGDVMYMKLGVYDSIMLNSYDSIQEAFVDQGEDFQDRPFLFITRMMMGNRGVLNSSGAVWRQLRRFTITALRDLGMGKRKMEDYILQEAEILANQLDKHVGNPLDISSIMSSAVSNIICHLVFNTHYEFDDDELVFFTKRFAVIFENGGMQSSRDGFMPYLLPLAFLKGKKTMDMFRSVAQIQQFIQGKINHHYDNFDPENIRDFVDMYIQFDKTSQEDREGVVWSKDNLFTVIFDLIMAGTETSATTLKWGILYLMHNPEIQKKCREEIQKVIGNRPPIYSERSQLPYIAATIAEIQRLGTIVPMAMHATSRDVEFRGYKLPKGLIVFGNIYAANTDPKYYPDPHTFNPDRWLNEAGEFHKPTTPLVFGGGPRMCLGETLAKYEIFLFFTTIIQRFELSMVDQANPPSLEGIMGISMTPPKFEVNLQRT